MSKIIKILAAGAVINLTFITSPFAGDKDVIEVSKPEASAFSTFIGDTRPFLKGRLRYEWAKIDGFDDSYVLPLRNHFGIETGKLAGFSILAEGEHTWIISDPDLYNPYPGVPSTRAVIGDPENIQLNRLMVTYAGFDTKIVVGRQDVIIDDQRFVGTIPWRQNDQTLDAALIQNQSIKDLKLTYAYVEQVNRIFGELAPARPLTRFRSDSHLIHIEYAGLPIGKIRGFGYLLDFGADSPLTRKFSTNTYGLELHGVKEISDSGLNCTYLLTAAYQEDAGANLVNYGTGYYRAEFGLKKEKLNGGVGAEFLTSDGGRAAFQAPISTAHAFNGFADAFLVTPDNGLRDYYVWVGASAPFKITQKLALHYFSSDQGGDALGWEIDYVAKRKITEHFSALLKLAFLDGSGSQPDISRASIQVDYSY